MLRPFLFLILLVALSVITVANGFFLSTQGVTNTCRIPYKSWNRRPVHTSTVYLSGKVEINEHTDGNLEENRNNKDVAKKRKKKIFIKLFEMPNLLLDIFGLSLKSPVLPILTLFVGIMKPIPAGDFFFSIAYPTYLCFANRYRFDRNAPRRKIAADQNINDYKKLPLLREGRGPWFFKYVLTFGVIGIILPLLLILISTMTVAPPVTIAANAAAPHLYLTLCQCLMESLTKGPKFYYLTELLVPIGFNTYRLSCLKTWFMVTLRTISVDLKAATIPTSGNIIQTLLVSFPWQTASFLLALSNVVIWTYNLFVFLLLRTLPQYLDRSKFPDPIVSWKGQLFPVLSSSSDD